MGVLVLVPAALAQRVAALRASVGDVPEAGVPAHVTLLPPTVVAEAQLPAVAARLREVAAGTAPFDVRLRGTDTFRPVTDVVFLRVVEGAEQCDALQSRLRGGPLAVDLRYPYHPHVTLAHGVASEALDRAQAAMAVVDETFRVAEMVLFVDRGTRWSAEAVAPFGAGSASAAGA